MADLQQNDGLNLLPLAIYTAEQGGNLLSKLALMHALPQGGTDCIYARGLQHLYADQPCQHRKAETHLGMCDTVARGGCFTYCRVLR